MSHNPNTIKSQDDTTERLLKKIDDWEIPKSDKEYVTIEKEVWESTLRVSMERAGKIETLQKQLDIAKKSMLSALQFLACMEMISEEKCNEQLAFDELRKTLEDLNK